MTTQRITVVGLGPGDPDLITIKGMRAIADADIIFVPRSRDGESSLALQIARPWLRPDQQVVELGLVMSRDAAKMTPAWQAAAGQIHTALAERAGQGGAARGAYLLLGDPLLFGTFTYIWAELAKDAPHIQIDFIPGVTSVAAAAAASQVVLGATTDRVAIIPAVDNSDADDLRHLVEQFETVVLMKVGRRIGYVIDTLESIGMLENAVFAERVGLPDQRLVRDLRELRGQECSYFSIVIVRKS